MGRQRIFLAAAPVFLLAGCVERKLYLESDPAGADVYLDGRAVGKTPAEVPFDHYGGREVSLELPGYRPHREVIDLKAPWYQYPGIDLVTDVLLPVRLHDDHRFRFTLVPAPTSEEIPDSEVDAVRQRASDLRARATEPHE